MTANLGYQGEMDKCVVCRRKADRGNQRGLCESCWEREKALTDEAIARVTARIKESTKG